LSYQWVASELQSYIPKSCILDYEPVTGSIMARGGKREGAGGRPKWAHGKTKVIRVPEVLSEIVVSFIEFLDITLDPANVTWSNSDNVTESKVVDLTGIIIRSFNGKPCIYVSDLARVGYEIYPERLANTIKAREGREQGEREEDLRSDVQFAFQQLNILEVE
jgi:hypothetical protein